MSPAFLLPFKVSNQARRLSEILHYVPLRGCYKPPFHLKQVYNSEQLFLQQSPNNYVEVHLF